MTTDSEKMKSRYKKYRKILKNLTIMSDVFMRNVLKDRKCTEYILQVIMEKKNLKIVDQVLQKDYKNLQGRSAILDCVVQDADGKQFDVEIQQEKEGASPRRARYHSGLLDMNTLDPGQEFDRLPDTYVIFITWTDTLGRGLPIYHIGRTIEETGECFRDGSYIIYVDSSHQEETELGRLMHDFRCKEAKEMHSRILANRVRQLKETQKGVEIMCKEMDAIYRQGEKRGERRGERRGRAQAIIETKRETALRMKERGYSDDSIAELLKIKVSMVQKWYEEAKSV